MKYYLPTDPEILILGRTIRKNPLPLFWTASGLEFRTDASELWFILESDYDSIEEWIRIEVDGFCLQRFIVPRGKNRLCAFRGFPSNTMRTVKLLKEIQPMPEDEKRCLLVHSLECDGKIYLPKPSRYRFEFIGDSLSAGVGLSGSPSLLHAGPAVYGLTGNYALITASHFQADFRILAECGWGVYCSCYNDFIHVMPKYYEQICGVLTGEKNRRLGAFSENDFNLWRPDVIIINLGSNDGFAIAHPAWLNPEDGLTHKMALTHLGELEASCAFQFEAAVKTFLAKLRRLNPDSYLLWAYGMCEHRMAPYLEQAIEDYQKETGDKKADFLLLPATNPLWIGSDNHPGKKEHALAAEVLIHKITDLFKDKQ